MIKKIIWCISLFFCLILNIVLDSNIKNYISILEKCFHTSIVLDTKLYLSICFIIAFISVLMLINIKLVVFYKKEEIKGINLKSEDGTYGTANWMSDKEINDILGKNDVPGIILGKKNDEIIKLPFDSHFNKNIAIFGSSGSMKTIRIFNN